MKEEIVTGITLSNIPHTTLSDGSIVFNKKNQFKLSELKSRLTFLKPTFILGTTENGGTLCDNPDGACACGAYHHLENWEEVLVPWKDYEKAIDQNDGKLYCGNCNNVLESYCVSCRTRNSVCDDCEERSVVGCYCPDCQRKRYLR